MVTQSDKNIATSKIIKAINKIKTVQETLSNGKNYTQIDNDNLTSAINQLNNAIELLDLRSYGNLK